MSKGEIVESLGSGKYRIKLLYAAEKIAAELVRINNRIAELAVIVPQKRLAVLQAGAAVKAVQQLINDTIPLYQQKSDGAAKKIRELQVDLVKKKSAEALAIYYKDLSIMENFGLLKRRNTLEKAPKERLIYAWCADFTEYLTGIIGIADINDEPNQGAIIRPGYTDDAAYLPVRDGELFPNEAQSGHQIYFNYAVLPGVQKWKPRYRIGEISNINNDACTVTLDDAFSSAQDLPINETAVLLDVPIQYMECNGDAFAEGDRALVRMFDSGPQVIGFESSPKPCLVGDFAFIPALYDGGFRTTYGEPFQDGSGNDINPPLGTQGGTDPAWTLKVSGATYEIRKAVSPNVFGNRNWIGPSGKVLSWDGPPGRIFDYQYESTGGSWRARWAQGSKVYFGLSVLADLAAEDVGGYSIVCGASLTDVSGTEYLIVICSASRAPGESFRCYRWPTALKSLSGPAEFLYQWKTPDTSVAITDWYFNRDGYRAACTLRSIFVTTGDKNDYDEIFKGSFSISAGFSMQSIFDRQALLVGTQTETEVCRRYLSQSEVNGVCVSDASNTNWWTRDVSIDSIVNDVYQPLYVEMIGNIETVIYLFRPGFTRTFRFSENANKDIEGTKTSRRDDLVFNGPAKVMLDTGQVIAEFPFTESYSQAFDYRGDGYSLTSASFSEILVRGGLQRNGSPIMAVDGRFSLALLAYGRGVRSVSASASDGFTFTTADASLTFTNPSGETAERADLGMWVGGILVKELNLSDSQGTVEVTVPAQGYYKINEDTTLGPDGCGGIGEKIIGPTTITEIPGPSVAPTMTSAIESCGFAASGNRRGYFVVYNDSIRDPYLTENFIFSMQGLTGYTDVASELFGQSAGQMLLMDGLTLA